MFVRVGTIRSGKRFIDTDSIWDVVIHDDGSAVVYQDAAGDSFFELSSDDANDIRDYVLRNTFQPNTTPVLPVAEGPVDSPNEALTKAAGTYRGPGYATRLKLDHSERQYQSFMFCEFDLLTACKDVDNSLDDLAAKYGRKWLNAALQIRLSSDTGRLTEK